MHSYDSLAKESQSSQEPHAKRVRVTISRSGIAEKVFFVESECTQMIGSRDDCGICLLDKDIAPTHCSLRFQDDTVWIHDWCTPGGTFVNEARISDVTCISTNDKVRIGEHTLRVKIEAVVEPLSEQKQEFCVDSPIAPANDVRVEVESPVAINSMTSSEDEMIEWLQAEVVQLQYEIAERDARISELTDDHASGLDEFDDNPTDSHLLERFDDLLDELTRSDDRTRDLEELLRASEEANRAEIEERHQLESWVSDIEKQIQQREAEWEAEIKAARSRLDDEVTQRRQLEEQLRDAFQGRGVEGSQRQEIERLEASCQQLRQKLEAADHQREELTERLEQSDAEQAEQRCRAQVDEAIREERIILAQERAEIARQRADLASRSAELSSTPTERTSNVDDRVRVFREHLREIQVEEKQERIERSMSARLSRLWQQLGGTG